MKVKGKSLSVKAKENASVVKKNSDKTEDVLKEGTPLDHSTKHSSTRSVGVSIGVTKNMGDYESLRADVWLTDEIKDNETPEKAYERVIRIVDKVLEEVVDSYM